MIDFSEYNIAIKSCLTVSLKVRLSKCSCRSRGKDYAKNCAWSPHQCQWVSKLLKRTLCWCPANAPIL